MSGRGSWRPRERRPQGVDVLLYEMYDHDWGTQFSDEGLGPAQSGAQRVLFAELESASLQPRPQASLSPTFLTSWGRRGPWAWPSCRPHHQGPLICCQLWWLEPGLACPGSDGCACLVSR